MSKVTYWLRWLTFIPGAFLASFIINYLLLGLILIFISAEKAAYFLNIFLFPFTGEIIFVYIGSLIAPQPKMRSLIIVFIITIILVIPLPFIKLPEDKIVEIMFPTLDNMLRLIMSLIGAVVGFCIAKKSHKTIRN